MRPSRNTNVDRAFRNELGRIVKIAAIVLTVCGFLFLAYVALL
jgi:hypothetical protein